MGNGDIGPGDVVVGVLLARESDLCASNFQPLVFFYPWVFECDLAWGAARLNSSWGLSLPAPALVVLVRRGALPLASPWSLKKGARTSIFLLEPGVSPASCTRVLTGFYSQQELVALHERTRARPKACEWVGTGIGPGISEAECVPRRH